jgi:hypothetical protein
MRVPSMIELEFPDVDADSNGEDDSELSNDILAINYSKNRY